MSSIALSPAVLNEVKSLLSSSFSPSFLLLWRRRGFQWVFTDHAPYFLYIVIVLSWCDVFNVVVLSVPFLSLEGMCASSYTWTSIVGVCTVCIDFIQGLVFIRRFIFLDFFLYGYCDFSAKFHHIRLFDWFWMHIRWSPFFSYTLYLYHMCLRSLCCSLLGRPLRPQTSVVGIILSSISHLFILQCTVLTCPLSLSCRSSPFSQ